MPYRSRVGARLEEGHVVDNGPVRKALFVAEVAQVVSVAPDLQKSIQAWLQDARAILTRLRHLCTRTQDLSWHLHLQLVAVLRQPSNHQAGEPCLVSQLRVADGRRRGVLIDGVRMLRQPPRKIPQMSQHLRSTA